MLIIAFGHSLLTEEDGRREKEEFERKICFCLLFDCLFSRSVFLEEEEEEKENDFQMTNRGKSSANKYENSHSN